jgi:WhiB family transcriptional regulator, redox-sensing transcriptional regulator
MRRTYTTLRRLERDGLIEPKTLRPDASHGRSPANHSTTTTSSACRRSLHGRRNQLNHRQGAPFRAAPVRPPSFEIEAGSPVFTTTELCVNSTDHGSSPLDPSGAPIDKLVDALACRSSPQWNAARCRHTISPAIHLFFSDNVADINQARRICVHCPVAAPCLQGALDRHEPCGVWGGYLFANGEIVAHKRPRGRPPKHRPAQDIIQLGAHVPV